ncbi:MAG: hypothetical protein KBG15_07085 [Kofleriaceae bacterium]|nr:hypothetical protein [Kofleriaceae bacterium]
MAAVCHDWALTLWFWSAFTTHARQQQDVEVRAGCVDEHGLGAGAGKARRPSAESESRGPNKKPKLPRGWCDGAYVTGIGTSHTALRMASRLAKSAMILDAYLGGDRD